MARRTRRSNESHIVPRATRQWHHQTSSHFYCTVYTMALSTEVRQQSRACPVSSFRPRAPSGCAWPHSTIEIKCGQWGIGQTLGARYRILKHGIHILCRPPRPAACYFVDVATYYLPQVSKPATHAPAKRIPARDRVVSSPATSKLYKRTTCPTVECEHVVNGAIFSNCSGSRGVLFLVWF